MTGASGYVGSQILAFLRRHGFQVKVLVREPWRYATGEIEAFPYQLAGAPEPRAFLEVDAIIHTASSTRARKPLPEEVEVNAAGKLLDMAERCAVEHFIFLSSQTSEEGARSKYARVKWAVERLVLARGGSVLRAGLVYGGADQRAVFGALSKLTRWSPCIPAFVPAPLVQPIHIDDLCLALLGILRRRENRPAPYLLAQPEAISLTTLLRTLAWHRYRRYPIAVPIPFTLVGLAAVLCRVAPFIPEGYSERLRGLQSTVPMDTASDCQTLGVVPRSFADGLTPAAKGRRGVLEEGRALLRYVSGRAAQYSTLRRYVRLLEQLKKGRCLDLPPFFLKFPATLRLMDPRFPTLRLTESCKRELAWRMEAAVILAETHPGTAEAFHLRAAMLLPVAAARLAISLAAEILMWAVALGLSGLRRRRPPQGYRDAS